MNSARTTRWMPVWADVWLVWEASKSSGAALMGVDSMVSWRTEKGSSSVMPAGDYHLAFDGLRHLRGSQRHVNLPGRRTRSAS